MCPFGQVLYIIDAELLPTQLMEIGQLFMMIHRCVEDFISVKLHVVLCMMRMMRATTSLFLSIEILLFQI